MKNKELKKILIFLQQKKAQFHCDIEEFTEHPSASMEPPQPIFFYDLVLYREEVIKNTIFEEPFKIIRYYSKILDELRGDNYIIPLNEFLFSNSPQLFIDRESYLDEFYLNNPDSQHGEGEVEYIRICFAGFVQSYSTFLEEVINTIESNIPGMTQSVHSEKFVNAELSNESKSSHLTKISDEEISQFISKCICHLNGVNHFKGQIMENGEYERLHNALISLVKFKDFNADLLPFNLKGISQGSIRYTLYEIHKGMFPTRSINDIFILFLMKAFPELTKDSVFNTHKTKFSTKPKGYPDRMVI